MIDTHLFKPILDRIPRMNPKINYGFSGIMICQCGFIIGKQCTILLSDANNGEGYAYVGPVVIGKSLYHPLINFTVNLKMS